MLTPAYLASLPDYLVDIFDQVDTQILQTIIRQIERDGKITSASAYQIRKAAGMRTLNADITKRLSSALKVSDKEIKRMMYEAGETALAFDDAIYIAAGLNPAPIVKSTALNDVILAGIRKTNGMMRNFTNTAAQTASAAYSTLLDRAYIEVAYGVSSPDTAMRRAVTTLVKQGMEKVAYPSGKTDSIETAVRRAVMTGVNQTTAELQIMRMKEMGCSLVEVTSHAGARPSHAVWQGAIYRYNP